MDSFNHSPFLDNLIPLKANIRQAQTAGWTPGPAVHSGLGCKVHADQMIPVGPGISLAADIYTPKVAGRYPAVVVFSAYSHQLQSSGAPTGTNETGEPSVFTDRGYNHLVVSRRGMGRSQGDSVIFFNDTDVDDHVAVIEWCAQQPWCDGNVVLFGTSYYAVVQPLVAVRQPAALKGFFAYGTDTDYFRQIAMFGGVPQVDFLTLWMGANFTPTLEKLHVPPLVRAALSHLFNSPLKHLWQPLVQKRLISIMDGFKKQTPALKYRQLFADWVFDGKSRATHTIPAGPYSQLEKLQVPFVIVEDMGAFNLHQYGAYELLQKAGTPSDRQWLIMAPPEYELPVYRWQLEALAFFDHIVYESDNGYAAQARVRYFLEGASHSPYRSASNFPLPNTRKVRFYPSSNGLDKVTHRLETTIPAQGEREGKNSWAAVPFGAITPPKLDEVANPVLTFETSLNEEAEVEYSGPVTLSLQFSCSEIDSHVIARLGKVDSKGVYHLLSLGSIRPALRCLDEERSTLCEIVHDVDHPQPLLPGQPVTLLFSLTPRPVLLKSGEKLRLDVASRTDLLRSNVSQGYEQFEMMVPPYFSRNTIHYGAETYLELSVVNEAF